MENPSDPKTFASLAEATEAYLALQGELEAATALSDEAGANLATAQADLSRVSAELATATAQIESLTTAATESAKSIADLTAAYAELKESEKTAEQKAAQIAANSGVPPVEGGMTGGQSSISRKDLQAMPLKEQVKVIKSGFKVTD